MIGRIWFITLTGFWVLCSIKYMVKNKTYKAQALAIIMVILVISSIIGFSVFSRITNQKKNLIQERDSAEAYQVADMILDNLLLSEPEDWVEAEMPGITYTESLYKVGDVVDPVSPPSSQLTTKINAESEWEKEKTVINEMEIEKDNVTGKKEISDLTKRLGHALDLQSLNICPLNEHDNKYTLQLTNTNEDTIFDLRPGETFVFPLAEGGFGGNCQINLTFPKAKTSQGGFTVNNIYTEGDNIKAYDFADTKNYCFAQEGNCSNENFTNPKGWDKLASDTDTPLQLPIGGTHERIQITAIAEDLSFKFSMSDCDKDIELWQLRASATCNGTYRAKEVIVPNVGWSFSIFNYVFFNGFGDISSATR